MTISSAYSIFQQVIALVLSFGVSLGTMSADPGQNVGMALNRPRLVPVHVNLSDHGKSIARRSLGEARPDLSNSSSGVSPRSAVDAHPQASTTGMSDTLRNDVLVAHPQTVSFSTLPISFEPNEGQVESDARFLAHGKGYMLLLKDSGPELLLNERNLTPKRTISSETVHPDRQLRSTRLKFIGASPSTAVLSEEELPGKVNYFLGNDPSKWRTNIPTYRRVKFERIYPGIDLAYYGTQQRLEFDFVIAPGADPDRVEFAVEGADKVRIAANGDLILQVNEGEIRQQLPRVYQDIHGIKRYVAGSYVRKGPNRIGFKLARYDRGHELIIDPVLLFATYLGGSGADKATSIAVDFAGNAYVTGTTFSLNFPITPGVLQTSCTPGTVANSCGTAVEFVSKLNAAGDTLIYSTFLGNVIEAGFLKPSGAIAVDGNGNAYVTGEALSDFPTTTNALQPTAPATGQNAFVTKLNTTGSGLLYSSYLGGSAGATTGLGIAVDSNGDVYVTGNTTALDFPTSPNVFQKTYAGDAAPTAGVGRYGAGDGFVTKIDPTKNGAASLAYSTFLGGTGVDIATGIAVDSLGDAYVSGHTTSTDFPITPGVFQKTLNKCGSVCTTDLFIAKLSADGSTLLYSTYLGGSLDEYSAGIALDGAGNAYVAAWALSPDYPTLNPIKSSCNRDTVGLCYFTIGLTKLNPTGSALVYSTYLGGSFNDYPQAITVDFTGQVYLTGTTNSLDFPVIGQLPNIKSDCTAPSPGGSPCFDAFVLEVNSAGSGLVYSTYLGGTSADQGFGIAVDAVGNAYVTGATQSSIDFPISRSAIQPVFGGGVIDGFVARLSGALSQKLSLLAISPETGGDIGFVSATALGSGFLNGATVKLLRGGQSVPALGASVDASGESISASFDLRGQSPGAWDVVVTNPGGASVTLAGGFTIEAGVLGHVWVDLLGNTEIRLGSFVTLVLMIGNTGNVDALGVPVWIAVPRGSTVTVDNLSTPPVTSGSIDLTQIPITFDAAMDTELPLFVPVVPAKGTVSIVVHLNNFPPVTPFPVKVWANPPFFDPSGNESLALITASQPSSAKPLACLEAMFALTEDVLGIGQDVKCEEALVSGFKSVLTDLVALRQSRSEGDFTAFSFMQITAHTVDSVIAAGTTCGVAVSPTLAVISNAVSVFMDAFDALGQCGIINRHEEEKILNFILVISHDPNGKFGSQGVGELQYISGQEPLRYEVAFADKPTAAAAQKVVITDQLDSSKLDLSTFRFGPIFFGADHLLVPPSAPSDFSQKVDLRPRINLLAQVNAHFDAQSGLITWTFISLDPATGLPTTDPRLGFLPPDTNPPNGEGGVVFSAQHKQGLPTNTQVTNQASIVFDANAPIATGTWINTLDNTDPVSHVLALPSTESSANFSVQWTGTDVGSGMQDFTIFESQDGGPFIPFLTNTPATSATFPGQFGHSYSFYSIARDLTGNLEPIKTTADATTRVQVNSPPVANAGPNQTVECSGHNGTPVTLNGLASTDSDGDSLTYTWKNSTGTVVGTSPMITQVLPLGTFTYTLIVTDSAGLSSTASTMITVRDTTPPTISNLSATPAVLRRHRDKWVLVTINYSAVDGCSASATCTLAVMSNEPNGRQPQWKIIDSHHILLRAESLHNGTGLIYTVVTTCVDPSGNTAAATIKVPVRKKHGDDDDDE